MYTVPEIDTEMIFGSVSCTAPFFDLMQALHDHKKYMWTCNSTSHYGNNSLTVVITRISKLCNQMCSHLHLCSGTVMALILPLYPLLPWKWAIEKNLRIQLSPFTCMLASQSHNNPQSLLAFKLFIYSIM